LIISGAFARRGLADQQLSSNISSTQLRLTFGYFTILAIIREWKHHHDDSFRASIDFQGQAITFTCQTPARVTPMGTEEAPPGRSIEVALENTTTSVNKDAESYEMPW
jgi:hypothetical protein